MKAYVLREIGTFGIEEAAAPVPAEGEVLVAVKAAGICGSDIPRAYYTGTYSYPLIPGHEFSGVVTACGDGVDVSWLGRRAGVFPLIPCGKCGPCQQKQYEMCRSYSYLGSRTDGGFAEYVRVPVWNLLPLPDCVTFEQAAMLEPMAVAVHAMRRAELKENDRVAVCGLGTIGLFLLMFLRERGIRDILVMGNKEIQRKKASELGVPEEYFLDIRTGSAEHWLKKQESEHEIQVFFDCVGRNEAVEQAVRHTAPGGRVVVVGNPASDMTFDRQTYWKILRNQLTLMGTWNSSFTKEESDDWHYVLNRLKEGTLHPERLITHRFGFGNLERGFELMRDKTEEYVKVMGTMD